jgi:hypothetical protein
MKIMPHDNHEGVRFSRRSELPPKEYERIHYWIRKNYGKATSCESKDCKGISKKFEWAKVTGVAYERNRGNFIMLCGSCHRKYDMTEELREKLSKANLGKKMSKESLAKRSLKRKGVTLKCLWQPIYAYKDGVLAFTFNTLKEASEGLNASVGYISACLSPRYPQAPSVWGYVLTRKKVESLTLRKKENDKRTRESYSRKVR